MATRTSISLTSEDIKILNEKHYSPTECFRLGLKYKLGLLSDPVQENKDLKEAIHRHLKIQETLAIDKAKAEDENKRLRKLCVEAGINIFVGGSYD